MRHFVIHLFYSKLNTVLYSRFHTCKVGMSHACRKETPAYSMMLWISCAEERSDAPVSNVAVEVGFAIMTAHSMDLFNRINFGDVELVGTDSHYRTCWFAQKTRSLADAESWRRWARFYHIYHEACVRIKADRPRGNDIWRQDQCTLISAVQDNSLKYHSLRERRWWSWATSSVSVHQIKFI